MKNKTKNYTAVLILILIILGFFYKSIIFDKIPAPVDSLVGLYHPFRDYYAREFPRGVAFKNYLITDPVRQQIPWRKVTIDYIKSGRFPGYNPFSFSGTNLTANIQAAVFSPFNLLFLIFPFVLSWSILIILQTVIAGILMFLYLKNRQFDIYVSIIGAIVWCFCGFNMAWLTWGTIVASGLWLPLSLLSMDGIILNIKGNNQKKTILNLLLLLLSYLLIFSGGHSQVAFYAIAFSGLYFTYEAILNLKSKKLIHAGLKFLTVCLVFGILSIFQWLPVIDLINSSSRFTDNLLWQKAGWFLPWQNLIQFIVPDFFGNPATLNYWGIWNYGEFIGYIGILPLIFSVSTLYIRKDKNIGFWWMAVVLCSVLMLPNFISNLPFILKIPVLSALQPTRLMVIVDFSLVMLSVYGLEYYLKNKSKLHRMSFLVTSVIYLLLLIYVFFSKYGFPGDNPVNYSVALRNMIFPGMLLFVILILFSVDTVLNKFKSKYLRLEILILAIVVFDLFRFGWKFTPFSDPEYFFPQTETIKFLKSAPGPFRIVSLDKRLMPGNISSFYQIEDVGGYDSLYNSRYEELIASINRSSAEIDPPFGFDRIVTVENINSKIFPLLSARYILSLDEINHPDAKLIFKEGQTKVYDYNPYLSRVYLAAGVRSAESKQSAIDLLYRNDFDIRSEAVVEQGRSLTKNKLDIDETIRIFNYKAKEMSVMVNTKKERMIVILNPYDENWQITIDGKVTNIYRVNFAFTGIYIPAGSHRIDLIYHVY